MIQILFLGILDRVHHWKNDIFPCLLCFLFYCLWKPTEFFWISTRFWYLVHLFFVKCMYMVHFSYGRVDELVFFAGLKEQHELVIHHYIQVQINWFWLRINSNSSSISVGVLVTTICMKVFIVICRLCQHFLCLELHLPSCTWIKRVAQTFDLLFALSKARGAKEGNRSTS